MNPRYLQYWNHWTPRTVCSFEGEAGAGGGGGSEEKKGEEGKKEGEESKKGESDEPTDEEVAEIAQARNLLQVLKDPEASKEFASRILKSHGIELDKDSSKKEIKEAKATLRSIIEEGLGPEYKVLADRLEKVLSKYGDLFYDERVKPTNDHLANTELARAKDAATKAYEKVFDEFSNSKDLATEVAKLTKEFPPSEDTDPERYFRRLLKLAAEEKGIKLTSKGSKDAKDETTDVFTRRDRNRKDAMSRTASETTDDGKVKESSGKTKMTIDEAIAKGAAAAEQILRKK